jgi:hypothetical protein
MKVAQFDCSDGTHHFSVVEDDGALSTCVIHDSHEAAAQEMDALAPGVALPLPPSSDPGAMWDRFIAYHSKKLGVPVKNLIGGAKGMRQEFIDANDAVKEGS